MIITFDIGNTNISFGGMSEKGVEFTASLSSARTRTSDEYLVLLRQIAASYGVSLDKAEGAIICSVVPQLTGVIKNAARLACGIEPIVLGPGVKTGLNIRIDDPSELGGDFVAHGVAALASYPMPCVIVEMSMATTLGVLDAAGSYIGSVICPGVMLSQNALVSSGSQLLHVTPEAPEHVIGRGTVESTKSGVVYGAAAMLDGLFGRIEEELGQTPCILATGEWAPSVIPHCRREGIITEPNLMMYGLWLIYQKNRKS